MGTTTARLAELVGIESVEPTQGGSGEGRIAARCAEMLEGMGYAVEMQEVASGRPNVIARGGASGAAAKRRWLMEAHMDTVGVEGMKHDPFAAEIRGGRLWGRGAADCKGPLAAMLEAAGRVGPARLAERGIELWVVCSMGEETGNNGARASLAVLPERFERTIALEPTEAKVIHASKGIAAIEVDITGRSAHGSNPEVGVNAVYAAMEFTRRLRAFAKSEGRVHESRWVGKPSMNLGMIHAGIAPNVVPPLCHLELDWRVVPGERIEDVKAEMGRILDGLKAEGLCLDWALKQTQNNVPLETPEDAGLVREMAAACKAAGLSGETGGVRWCCDASLYRPRSEETIVFGPGSIRQAHASEEFIDTAELEAAADALARLLAGK